MKDFFVKYFVWIGSFVLISIGMVSCREEPAEPVLSSEQMKGTWLNNDFVAYYYANDRDTYVLDYTTISFSNHTIEVTYYYTYIYVSYMGGNQYQEKAKYYFPYKIENNLLKVYKADSGVEELISVIKVDASHDKLTFDLKEGTMFLERYEVFPNNISFKRINNYEKY